MDQLRITSVDTLDGLILLLELSDGSMLEFSLDQILSLTPKAVFPQADDKHQSDAN